MAGFQPTSHRVLAIPELLDMIFAFLDDKDNANNAQVCKTWSHVALETIWREPSDLHRLFSRLVPLVFDDNHADYIFEHLPTAADWARFSPYASRVRKLVYCPQDKDTNTRATRTLSRKVFDDIARTRLRMDVFPNLHTLIFIPAVFDARAHKAAFTARDLGAIIFTGRPLRVFPWDAMVFMHPGVKTFATYLPREAERGPTELRDRDLKISAKEFRVARGLFLSEIPVRMPALRTLDIRTSLRASSPAPYPTSWPSPPDDSSTLQDSLASLITSLSSLHKLVLPRFFFTSRVAEAASHAPNLGIVEFQYLPSQGCGSPRDMFPPTGTFKPDLSSWAEYPSSKSSTTRGAVSSALRLLTGSSSSSTSLSSPVSRDEGPFPSLYDLSLTSTFADLASFLDSPRYNPSRLTSLYVDSACIVETNADVARLSKVVQENCAGLKYLALVSVRDPGCVPSPDELDTEIQIREDNAAHGINVISERNENANDDELEDADRNVNPCITLPTILPLLSLPLLTSLEITHAWPLGLTLSDIATITSSLPGLDTLLLNTEPVHLYLSEDETSAPGLEVLSVVARRCQRLSHLGVFLDARGVGDAGSRAARRLRDVGARGDGSVPASPVKRALRALPFASDSEDEYGYDSLAGKAHISTGLAGTTAPPLHPHLSLSFSATSPTFSPSLTRLSLGVSAIDESDADAAALYLSYVLPLGCAIDFGVTWEETFSPSQDGGVHGAAADDGANGGMMDINNDDDADSDSDNGDDTDMDPTAPTIPIPDIARHIHRTHALHMTVQARCTVWERVAAQVPLLARLRQEERARTRAMERELERLRAEKARDDARDPHGVGMGYARTGTDGSGEGVRINLAATRKTSWMNLKEMGREWLNL